MNVTTGPAKPAEATGVHLEPGAVVPSATEHAQSGEPYILQPTQYDAILLSSFGGPEGQDDVIPFLRNVTRGRGIPDERLEEVAVHYRHFGGKSPINDQNRELQAALQAKLTERGIDLPVIWGNRNWHPYLNDALREADERGCTKLLAIATSAYSSYSSCRQYREDWADALEDTGLQASVQIDKVRAFYNHEGFVAPFVEGLRNAVAEAHEAGFTDDVIEVLFATHSIPNDDAVRSGDPAVEWPLDARGQTGGAYALQHFQVSELVAEQAAPGIAWQLVYQSRSGPASQPWLEPDINDAINDLEGRKAVIIVPIGFISDHMEVMWDLDEEATETAEEAGLWVRRTPTPGVHPAFVEGLVDLVQERIEGRPVDQRSALTALGVEPDVCRAGCCENVRRGFRPAIAGLQP